MHVLCFEDDAVDRLRPATLARAGFAITTGSYRLLDWLMELGRPVSADVRPHLRGFLDPDYGIAAAREIPAGQVLLVNARLAATIKNRAALQRIAGATGTARYCDPEDGRTLIAKLDAKDHASSKMVGDVLAAANALQPDDAIDLDVFRLPHDLVRIHMEAMPSLLEHRIATGNYKQVRDGVFVAENVRLQDDLAVDVSEGPVVLESSVSVGPFCFLAGPVYAGAGTRVIEHSALKDAVALGHTVKIGGEVEASVIEPYTNKQHHGFLGHSYLGSWINLGAGTCNSDLKNTYGMINVEYGDHKAATGMQFFGCVMGDYSKTAINTSIFTGKIIGVCSMMYGFVTSNVPSYVNYAKLFGQTSLLPTDVMIATQSRMFARRKVEQRELDRQLIRDMYDLTVQQRDADPEILL